MLLGKDKIREIVERTDIVEMIGRHVELKRAGRSYRGLCPFHGERTPSFYVTPERRSYKCFGCQKGGDVIRFVMEYEGKDFMTAVRDLAAVCGVTLQTDPEEDRRIRERRELLRACEVAGKFFAETLWSPGGAPGRAHLEGRGVPADLARQAGLGYALSGFHALQTHLSQEKVPESVSVAAGLLAHKQDSKGTYDVFRGRLMVPIRDPEGRVIAFGGRVVEGDDDRKYINTRETSLYVKGRVLYGLDVAREAIRRTSEAVLVEGYFDALALHAAGVKNAVALCSTALTPDHVTLLTRLEVKKVTLLLDGDEAGRKGAVRLAAPLLASGLFAQVLELPQGQDPDTFLRRQGRKAYDELLSRARPLSAFVLARALSEAGEGYEGRMRALAELRPVVAGLPEGAPRTLFLAEASKALGLPSGETTSFFQGSTPPARPAQQQAAGPTRAPARAPHAPAAPPAIRREVELCAALLAYSEVRAEFASRAAAQLFTPALRELAARLAEGEDGDETLSAIEPSLARALAARVAAMLRAPASAPARILEDGLLQVELSRLREERRAAMDERDALERELPLVPEAEKGGLREAIDDCKRRLAALWEEMERTRGRLRSELPV